MSVSGAQLRSVIERIEKLEEEIRDLNADKSDVFKEAKANGFDVAALRKIIAIRRQDPDKRAELDAVVETYMAALGMLPSHAHLHACEEAA